MTAKKANSSLLFSPPPLPFSPPRRCDAWIAQVASAADAATINGIIGTSPLLETTTPGWMKFSDAWQAIPAATGKYDLAPLDGYQFAQPATSANIWPAYNYDAVYFVANALHAVVQAEGIAGVSDPAKVVAALRSYRCADCATGDLKLTDEGELLANYQVTNVVDGVPEIVGTYIGGEYTFSTPIKFNSGTTTVPFDRTCIAADSTSTTTKCSGTGGRETITTKVEYSWLSTSLCTVEGYMLPETFEAPEACACNAGDYENQVTVCDSDVKKSIVYNMKEGRVCALDLDSSISLPDPILDIACAHVPSDAGLALIVTVCAVVGTISGFLAAIFAWMFRKAPAMRTAQPSFCILFSLFLGLLNISWILELGEHTDSACMMGQIWFHICFTLGFGAMVCKMQRVISIFSNKSLKKVAIKDSDLISSMIKLLLVEIVIMVAWAIVDPLKAVEVVESAGGVEYLELICQSKGEMFGTAAYFYKVLLLGYALSLAFKSRELGHFAESSEIAAAIYVIAIMSIVASVSGMFTDFNGNVLIKAMSSAMATVTAMGLFYAGKFSKRNMTEQEFKDSFPQSNASTALSTVKSTSITPEE
jgi:hypothetical protein